MNLHEATLKLREAENIEDLVIEARHHAAATLQFLDNAFEEA